MQTIRKNSRFKKKEDELKTSQTDCVASRWKFKKSRVIDKTIGWLLEQWRFILNVSDSEKNIG